MGNTTQMWTGFRVRNTIMRHTFPSESEETEESQSWWLMAIIQTVGRLEHEDCREAPRGGCRWQWQAQVTDSGELSRPGHCGGCTDWWGHPTRVSFRTYSEFQLTMYLKVMRSINFPKGKFTSSEIAWKSIFNRVRNAEENKSLENGEGSSVIADGKYRTDHWYSYCKDKWWPTKQSIYYLCVWNL